jgi:outer membrane autotransporter protein
VANYSGSTGTVNVDGIGSTWTNSGNLFVGNMGDGTLYITNGGSVESSDGHIGQNTGSGTVTVDGAGSAWNMRRLRMASSGNGILNISNGATVTTSDSAILSSDSDSVATVTVDGTGSTLSIGSHLSLGSGGTGTLTIANGGAVSVDSGSETVYIAEGSGSTGTLNIGAAAGNAAVAAGTLDAATIEFGDGTGKLVFNHTDTAYNFNADIAGTGDVDIYSGTTYFNGTISSDATTTVFGGTLGGSGTLDDISVNSGGTFAPGNSVGTINVANVTYNAGSTYEVELNDGGFVAGTNNDVTIASGTATINGGTVNVIPENGTDDGSTYTYGTYTILTAAGGVSGTFDSVTDSYVFLNFNLGYDANNVYLTSQQATEFIDVAQTYNQNSVANAVDALGSGNEVYDQLLTIIGTADDARAAMDDLSGEIHASARSAMIEDSRFVRQSATRRMATRSEVSPGLNVWGQGYGSRANWDDDNNASDMDQSSGGVLFGADTALSKTAHIGVLAGIGKTSLDVNDRSSEADYDSYRLGIYGGNKVNGFNLNGGVAYSRHNVDTERTVAFSSYSDVHEADYDANTLQVFGEAGYDIDVKDAVVTPFVGLSHVRVKTDGYTESGGAAALNADSSSESVTYSTLGVRGERNVEMVDGTKVKLSGELGWQHALGDADSSITQNFAGGDDFTIEGLSAARDSALLNLGAYVEISPSATLGVSYSGEFSGRVQQNVLKANLNVAF